MLKSLRSGLAVVDQIPLTKYDIEELRVSTLYTYCRFFLLFLDM